MTNTVRHTALAGLLIAAGCGLFAQAKKNAPDTETITPLTTFSTSETLTERGDLKVGIRVEAPTSWYEYQGSNLTWKDPEKGHTHYLKLTLAEPSGRFIPGSKVAAQLKSSNGKDVGTTASLLETWDLNGSHYGANLAVPVEVTSATIVIEAEPPKFRRSDKETGGFFPSTIGTTFTLVNLTTATLKSREKPSTASIEARVVWPEGRRPFVEPTPYPGSNGVD